MNIERDETENSDGTTTITTRTTVTAVEREKIREVSAMIRDLSGMTRIGGTEMYDQTAMIAMTEKRKKAFCDAADLIDMIVTGS